MIGGLATLLVCQLIGELLVALLRLPVPGPVLGMVLLFCSLLIRNIRHSQDQRDGSSVPNSQPLPPGLETAARGLLKHLALLFVPAGTGIIAYATLIREEWLPITLALISSTLLTLAVTGAVMQALAGEAREATSRGAADR